MRVDRAGFEIAWQRLVLDRFEDAALEFVFLF